MHGHLRSRCGLFLACEDNNLLVELAHMHYNHEECCLYQAVELDEISALNFALSINGRECPHNPGHLFLAWVATAPYAFVDARAHPRERLFR